jgi:uncharacterized protein YhhL (DUF1145 family)
MHIVPVHQFPPSLVQHMPVLGGHDHVAGIGYVISLPVLVSVYGQIGAHFPPCASQLVVLFALLKLLMTNIATIIRTSSPNAATIIIFIESSTAFLFDILDLKDLYKKYNNKEKISSRLQRLPYSKS